MNKKWLNVHERWGRVWDGKFPQAQGPVDPPKVVWLARGKGSTPQCLHKTFHSEGVDQHLLASTTMMGVLHLLVMASLGMPAFLLLNLQILFIPSPHGAFWSRKGWLCPPSLSCLFLILPGFPSSSPSPGQFPSLRIQLVNASSTPQQSARLPPQLVLPSLAEPPASLTGIESARGAVAAKVDCASAGFDRSCVNMALLGCVGMVTAIQRCTNQWLQPGCRAHYIIYSGWRATSFRQASSQ